MTHPEKWIWMPHPAHFIGSRWCRFSLATWVGKHIISTLGEYFPHEGGDVVEIGYQRIYETMVFKSLKNKECCGCRYIIADGSELTMIPANDPETAVKNHIDMCRKWESF